MIYESYDKPVFAWNTCRYDLPFCWSSNDEMMGFYNETIRRMLSNGQLNLVANNKADQDYFELGVGTKINLVPSLCSYTNASHVPKSDFFYWYSLDVDPPCNALLKKRSGAFTWDELSSYKAVIHVPYEISTMSLYEQYTAGIPLIVPTAHPPRIRRITGTRELCSMGIRK